MRYLLVSGLLALLSTPGFAFDVVTEFNTAQSAQDRMVNERTMRAAVDKTLRSVGITPRYVAKSKNGYWLQVKVQYVYLEPTETRFMSIVSGVRDEEQRELCGTQTVSWRVGAGGHVNINEAITNYFRHFLRECGVSKNA